jgi:hypothetical protein
MSSCFTVSRSDAHLSIVVFQGSQSRLELDSKFTGKSTTLVRNRSRPNTVYKVERDFFIKEFFCSIGEEFLRHILTIINSLKTSHCPLFQFCKCRKFQALRRMQKSRFFSNSFQQRLKSKTLPERDLIYLLYLKAQTKRVKSKRRKSTNIFFKLKFPALSSPKNYCSEKNKMHVKKPTAIFHPL